MGFNSGFKGLREEIQRVVDASYAWRSMARKREVERGDPEQHMTTHD